MFISNFTHQKIILNNHGSMQLTKSRFLRKITSHLTFHWNKLGHSQIMKIPFTILYATDLFFEDFSHFSLALK